MEDHTYEGIECLQGSCKCGWTGTIWAGDNRHKDARQEFEEHVYRAHKCSSEYESLPTPFPDYRRG